MNEADQTLYRRLGGYDVIAAVIDDMLAAMRADPAFARFGAGRSIDSHTRTRQLLVEQMCELSGGPCVYIGRDMKTSHRGMGITAAEWSGNIVYAEAALVAHRIRGATGIVADETRRIADKRDAGDVISYIGRMQRVGDGRE